MWFVIFFSFSNSDTSRYWHFCYARVFPHIAASNFHTIPINSSRTVYSSVCVNFVCTSVGCGVVVFSILIKKGMQYRTLPSFCFWFNFHFWCFLLLYRLTFHNTHTVSSVCRHQFYQWMNETFFLGFLLTMLVNSENCVFALVIPLGYTWILIHKQNLNKTFSFSTFRYVKLSSNIKIYLKKSWSKWNIHLYIDFPQRKPQSV